MKLDIILRTCTRVHAFSGMPRLNFFTKKEVVFGCLQSLADSIALREVLLDHNADKIDYKLHIIDDNSGEDLNTIKDIVKDLDHVFVPIVGTGNAASIKTCYDYALDNNLEHIYFVEDDYLHERFAIQKMWLTYRSIINRLPIIIHPYDCPDRYTRNEESKDCQLYYIKESDHLWRTIKKTTGTFLVSRKILEANRTEYYKFANYGIVPGITEDNSINLIYNKVLCMSPIPTLATHLQYESTIPLGYDWTRLWEQLK